MITLQKNRWNCFMLSSLVIFSSIILVFIASACTQKKESIKIGLLTTLTGAASTSGIHSRNAGMLAVEQINKTGGINGRPIELFIRDDKGIPEEALRVAKELVDEGVVAIIGPYLSSLSVKIVPLMNEENVLMISAGSTTVELTGLDDNFIRLMIPDDKRAPLMADMVYNRLNIREIAVVYDLSNKNYTSPLSHHFKNRFEQKGGKISAMLTFNSREGFSASDIVKGIMDSNAEGVLLITNAIDGAIISQHLRKNDSKIKITASAWTFPEPDFIRNGGHAVEGVTCLVEFNKESSNKEFLQFKEQYKSKFTEEISITAQIAFEAMKVLFSGLSKTDESAKLKEAILKQSVFQGLNDDIIIDKYGDPVRPLYIQKIEDSKIRDIGKFEPTNL